MPSAHAQSRYKFIRLGAPAGYSSGGYGVNDAGHVVGITQAGGGYATAFFWSDANGDSTFQSAEMQSLGTFGGLYSDAKAINSADVVVGSAAISGNGDAHAYIWAPGQGPLTLAQNDLNNFIDQSALAPGCVLQVAYDINDSGVIAARAGKTVTNPDGTTSNTAYPCLLTPSTTQAGRYTVTELTGTFPAATWPSGGGLSSTGAAVVRGNQYNSLFWNGTSSSLTTMDSAYSVNAGGTIVGWSRFGTFGYAAVSAGPTGAVQSLGTLGGTSSRAWDINDGSALYSATTVGTAAVIVTPATRGKPAVEASHAFRWQGAGGLSDLNPFVALPSASKPSKATVLWYLMAAYAISPNGTIVGISGDGGSTNPNYAYVLIPTP